MLTQTVLREVVRQAQLAICEYHLAVHNIALYPKRQRIYWHAGRGWVIGGVMYPGTGEQVTEHFDALQRRWRQKTLDFQRGLDMVANTATPEEEAMIK